MLWVKDTMGFKYLVQKELQYLNNFDNDYILEQVLFWTAWEKYI